MLIGGWAVAAVLLVAGVLAGLHFLRRIPTWTETTSLTAHAPSSAAFRVARSDPPPDLMLSHSALVTVT